MVWSTANSTSMCAMSSQVGVAHRYQLGVCGGVVSSSDLSSSVCDKRVDALVAGAVVCASEGADDGSELDGVMRGGMLSDEDVSVAS